MFIVGSVFVGDSRDLLAQSPVLLTQSPVVPGTFAQGFLATDGDPYAIPSTGVAVAPAAGIFGNGGLFSGRFLSRLNPATQTPLLPGVRQHLGQRVYLRAEYLYWDVDGMGTPALVTSSPAGTPSNLAGVLGESGTRVLFGSGQLNGGSLSGARLGAGIWLTPAQRAALEVEYIGLEDQVTGYRAGSDGSPILARPAFDIAGAQETAQLIAYPGISAGNIDISARSEFRSFLINGRVALCPTPHDFCQQCGVQDRVDLILGYRHLQLEDSFTGREFIDSQVPNIPGTLSLVDQFQTQNEFNGLQLGLVHRKNYQRLWLESMMRVAVGNHEQTLTINGSNVATESGVSVASLGGYFAQSSNIGQYTRDDFSMIPELGFRVGIQLTRSLHASVGYTALYFPNVVRATEQIDTDVNPGLFAPPQNPLIGAPRPRVLWVESSYLAHGISFGGELQF